MRKMHSIRTQLAILFLLIVLIIMGASAAILPGSFNRLVEETFFETIDASLVRGFPAASKADLYVVQHLNIDVYGQVLTRKEDLYSHRFFTDDFLSQLLMKTKTQVDSKERYVIELEDGRVYVIIERIMNIYRVSYMFDIYGSEFRSSLITGSFTILLVLAMAGLVGMYLYSHFLINRIIRIKHQVEGIAGGRWDGPVAMEASDELGFLAGSIEDMRVELNQQETYKNELFQSVSHDLKTPIMIIGTYAQSAKDGLYPEGELGATLDAIIEEAGKLDGKVQQILLLNKINYLRQRKEEYGEVEMKALLETTVRRFRMVSRIEFDLRLDEAFFRGDREKWTTAIENILTNNLRYAKTVIRVTLQADTLTIFNDGDPIEFERPDQIFKRFTKGRHGHNGIGLAITKSILDLFGYGITAHNRADGVEFVISEIVSD